MAGNGDDDGIGTTAPREAGSTVVRRRPPRPGCTTAVRPRAGDATVPPKKANGGYAGWSGPGRRRSV
ncbi:hypothetical protein Vse01_52130 [Micromonospora sediminimaris]|uniref:Uncharacterized protein n=1 Tax=Micromonospora sediminimaris TaxID=547162 RepID=A0A9W5XM52_9ACTN|nr:hypothetical protein Vse01_52130 [Micromonospora sediminimaris]